MTVIILDKDLRPYAPIVAMRTLIWTRRHNEPGKFELHCGADDFQAIKGGAYVYRTDRKELGVIQEADLSRNEAGARTCYCKGYFAEALLDGRVIERSTKLSGTPEAISRSLVNDYFIDAYEVKPDGTERGYKGRNFEHIALGPESGIKQEEVTVQRTGTPVGETMYEIEAEQGLAHRVEFDAGNRKMSVRVVGSESRGMIFSDDFSNIISAAYHIDRTDAPNVVWVAGSGEGSSRILYRLDMRESEDEEASEMYIDARDLQKVWTDDDGDTHEYSDEDYEAMLRTRGLQKLESHKVLESFDVEVDKGATAVYGTDYDLGDICLVRATIQGKDRLELKKKITAIQEVYEDGKESMSVTFGDTVTTNLKNFVAESQEVNSDAGTEAGSVDLSGLETEDKSSATGAINEANKKAEDANKKAGNLEDLKTDSKGSLTDAVNELYDMVQSGGGGGSGTGDGSDSAIAVDKPNTLNYQKVEGKSIIVNHVYVADDGSISVERVTATMSQIYVAITKTGPQTKPVNIIGSTYRYLLGATYGARTIDVNTSSGSVMKFPLPMFTTPMYASFNISFSPSLPSGLTLIQEPALVQLEFVSTFIIDGTTYAAYYPVQLARAINGPTNLPLPGTHSYSVSTTDGLLQLSGNNVDGIVAMPLYKPVASNDMSIAKSRLEFSRWAKIRATWSGTSTSGSKLTFDSWI